MSQHRPGHRVPPPPTTMPYADALAAIEALEALVELQHAHIENLIERVAALESWAESFPPDV